MVAHGQPEETILQAVGEGAVGGEAVWYQLRGDGHLDWTRIHVKVD